MRRSSDRISPVLVIIFGLLGLLIIQAGIHDAIFFGEYEDLAIAIPAGLLFGLPPLFIYFGDKKGENKSAKERAEIQAQGTMRAFFWFHVIVLIIMIINSENINGPILIVYLYMSVALVYSGYTLLKMRNGTYKHNSELRVTDFKTKRTISVNLYDENGEMKSTEKIKDEIRAKQNSDVGIDEPIKNQDEWNENYVWSSNNEGDIIDNTNGVKNSIRYENSEEPVRNNNTYDDRNKDVKNVARKIEGIIQIVSGVIWIIIIACLFYIPRFFEDNVPTTYIKNNIIVTKEEFYSDPIGLLFLLLGFIPIVCGIVALKKSR